MNYNEALDSDHSHPIGVSDMPPVSEQKDRNRPRTSRVLPSIRFRCLAQMRHTQNTKRNDEEKNKKKQGCFPKAVAMKMSSMEMGRIQ